MIFQITEDISSLNFHKDCHDNSLKAVGQRQFYMKEDLQNKYAMQMYATLFFFCKLKLVYK